jgi:hypothetical protein
MDVVDVIEGLATAMFSVAEWIVEEYTPLAAVLLPRAWFVPGLVAFAADEIHV